MAPLLRYMTTPLFMSDTTVICESFDRGAFADFPDVDREFVLALNGADFVRTSVPFAYYTQPYNLTTMAPVTGGSTLGGTIITLHGLGFHEYEGTRTPQFARCRFTDGLDMDETIALYLSSSELRCATPSKPDTAVHDLLVSLNGADFDPTPFSFGFYSMEPQRSRRVTFRVHVGIDQVPAGSQARVAFEAALRQDLAASLMAVESSGRNVTASRLQVVRIVSDSSAGGGGSAGRRLQLAGAGGGSAAVESSESGGRQLSVVVGSTAYAAISVVVEILPVNTGRLPTPFLLARSLADLVGDASSPLYDRALRSVSHLIDATVAAQIRLGFVLSSIFDSLSVNGGPLQGGTVVHLEGAALDAFNSDTPEHVRCRWGEEASGLVTPSFLSASRITCTTTPRAVVGVVRLYLSLNGIAPFEDTGLDFTYYRNPTLADVLSLSPRGGPSSGGTLVTVYATGLDALGLYKPPASGAARCRWGAWDELASYEAQVLANYRETPALTVAANRLECRTPPRGGSPIDELSVAINGQEFVKVRLELRYYEQPGNMVLVQGRLRGPSSGGTRWVMKEAQSWRGTLTGFDDSSAAQRYCRWGEDHAHTTLALSGADVLGVLGYNVSNTIVCLSAAMDLNFAGDVMVYVSLNGIDFAPTGLTFLYYREPRISAYAPQAGPIMCTISAVEGGSGAPVGDKWETNHLPEPACTLQRNWQPAQLTGVWQPNPQTIQLIAAGAGAGYSAGDTISIILDRPTSAGMAYVAPLPDADPSGPLRFPSGDKAYVDSLFQFVGNGYIEYDLARRPVYLAGFSPNQPLNLGADYSGAWFNEWTFVITLIDTTGASIAFEPSAATAGPGPGQLQRPWLNLPSLVQDPVVNLSSAVGFPQESISLRGIYQFIPQTTFEPASSNTYWWDGFDADKLRAEYMFDTPNTLCDRTRGESARECEFARYLYVPPVTTDVTITTVGLLPVLDGSTTARLRDAVRVRNVGSTSAAASTLTVLPLTGTFGSFDMPRIVSVVVSDPDSSALEYSDGDLITITFNVALSVTYRNYQSGGLYTNPNAGGVYAAAGVSGGRAFVNALFSVSGQLGNSYSGTWADSSTFVITVSDVSSNNGIRLDGTTTFSAKRCPTFTSSMCGDITNAARTSPPCGDSAVLTGSFGSSNAPRIVRFEASDPDEGDLSYGVGDRFEIEFDVATNRALDEGTRPYLDRLFSFHWPGEDVRNPALPSRVGDELRALWTDSSTLEVLATSIAMPPWPVQLGLTVAVRGDVQSPLLNAPSSRTVATLSSGPLPRIVSFVASDPDNGDTQLSAGDTLSITFDERARPAAGVCMSQFGNPSWPCAMSGGKRLVDELFDFSHPLGADYSGVWVNDFTFVVSIVNPAGGHVRTLGESTMPSRPPPAPPPAPPALLSPNATHVPNATTTSNASFECTPILLPTSPTNGSNAALSNASNVTLSWAHCAPVGTNTTPAHNASSNATVHRPPPSSAPPPHLPSLAAPSLPSAAIAAGPTRVVSTHWLLTGFVTPSHHLIAFDGV